MTRLESSLTNMVLSLTIVTVFAAAILGGMYVITKEPIENAQIKKQTKAKTDVLQVEGIATDSIYFAAADTTDGVIVFRAYTNNTPIGAAVQTFDKNGFNGEFRLMIGFDNDGIIKGYKVLEQNETPGLGANMTMWFCTDKGKQSIIGIDPAQTNMTVSKDGGDIDAITAATITSRAFLRAVNRAYNAFMVSSDSVQATTGATLKASYSDINDTENQTTIFEHHHE